MEETLIWVAGLIAEILLVVAAVLAVLLRRSRGAQQQLLARLADQEKHSAEAAEIPAEASAHVPVAPAVEAASSKTTDVSVTSEFDDLRESIDNARLDESVERLRQRLGATNQSLQRLASGLQQESTSPGQSHPEIASLQVNLEEVTTEVDSLQQSNAQLQQGLRDQTQAMEQAASERREKQERVLQHAKKLRGDIATLRDKLKHSEGDVQRLHSEKEALATEHAALNREYERIYANSPK